MVFPEIVDDSESAKFLAVIDFHYREQLQRLQLLAFDSEELGAGRRNVRGQVWQHGRLYVADLPPLQSVIAAFENIPTFRFSGSRPVAHSHSL